MAASFDRQTTEVSGAPPPAQASSAERLRVDEYEGQRALLADGVILSVAVETAREPVGYWGAMLPAGVPQNALLLGLGAGTLAQLLTRRTPGIRIVGVDFDPDVVAFARRHFDLSLPNLEVVVADAFDYVAACARQFDYIAVDLFTGHAFPRRVLAKPFLRRLQTLSGPAGEIAINLFKDRRSEVHIHRIGRILPVRRVDRLARNVVVHCGALTGTAGEAIRENDT
jgi:spermidine synthase